MAIYDQSALGTDNNKVEFNNYSQSPVYRVISRAPQRRDIRDLDIPLPFESGISDFRTLVGKTAYVIDGVMYPGGESEYDSGLAALRRVANLDIEQDDILSDDGYVPYVFTEFLRDKQIFMKPLYVELPESTRKGLVQPFRIVAKIKDPTIYGADLKQANTGDGDFSEALGTAIYPFSYPIIYGASTSSVSVDANNVGDTPVYPVGISIFGPVNSPIISNTTTGEFIRVNVNLATDDNNLIIAYDKDSLIVTLDGVSVINQVTTDSTYFKIQPGSNIFELTGSSIGDGAYAIISFRDGWALS